MTSKSASKGQKGKKSSNANKLLAGVQQNLFKILDELQTKEVSDAVAENTALNQFIQAEGNMNSISAEFGGPSPFFKVPDWNTYQKKFKPIIKRVLEEKTASQQEHKIIQEQLEETIKNQFLEVYNQSKIPSKNPTGKSALQPYVDWVQDAIIQLGTQITQNSQQVLMDSFMFDKTNGVITNEANLGKATWKNFEDPKSVTKKNPAGTGIWPSHFLPLVQAFLKTKDGPDVINHEVDEILNRLHVNLSQYDLANEESIRAWIVATITGLSKAVGITNLQKEELIAELEQVVTKLFPQADGTFFYDSFQEILYKNIINPTTLSPTLTELKDNLSEPDQEGTTSETTDATADPNEPAKTSAKPIFLTPSITSGLSQIVEMFFAQHKYPKSLAILLTRNIEAAIKLAIANSFNDLSEHGSQGSLLSTTYDYQRIARISNYATTLISELTNDLNLEIPKNSKESLDAAKSITAAAVSFREFSTSLSQLQASFENETKHTAAGANYKQIEKLVLHNENSKLSTLEDLGNYIYTGNGAPNPLIKQAEFQGVKIAAESAGLNLSLQKILITEEKDAQKALTKLQANAELAFNNILKTYANDAKSYFTGMGDFINKKQEFAYDELKHNAIIDAKDVLSEIMSDAIMNADTDALQ